MDIKSENAGRDLRRHRPSGGLADSGLLRDIRRTQRNCAHRGRPEMTACTVRTGRMTHLRHCPETELMLSWAQQDADRIIGMDVLTEPHFPRHPPGLTVGEIAALTGAELQDVANRPQRMTNVAPIDLAEAGDLTFVDNAKFAKALTSTRAGAVLVSEHFQCLVPSGLVVLLTPEPYKCFVLVALQFYPHTLPPSSLF